MVGRGVSDFIEQDRGQWGQVFFILAGGIHGRVPELGLDLLHAGLGHPVQAEMLDAEIDGGGAAGCIRVYRDREQVEIRTGTVSCEADQRGHVVHALQRDAERAGHLHQQPIRADMDRRQGALAEGETRDGRDGGHRDRGAECQGQVPFGILAEHRAVQHQRELMPSAVVPSLRKP